MADVPARPPRPTFVDERLLDGSVFGSRSVDRNLAWRVDAELRKLASIEAQLDLALGRGLARLHASKGHRDLGHSRQVDFAPARYGFSWSHARELIAIAEGLDRLPITRRAFLAGQLSRSRARLLVRVSTDEMEVRWLCFARRVGVRELEAEVKKLTSRFREEADAEKALPWWTGPAPATTVDDDADFVRVRWSTSLYEVAAWHGWGREMLRVIVGRNAPDWVLAEALAADSLATWGWGDDFEPVAPRAADAADAHANKQGAPDSHPPDAPEPKRRRKPTPLELSAMRKRQAALHPVPPPLDLPDLDACDDAWELHRALLHLVALRHGLAYERSRLLAWDQEHHLHRELGFRTIAEHADALGLAPRDVAHDVALHARLRDLPRCERAWRDGVLPSRTAAMIATIATRDTEAAWVEWASRTTSKHLQLEIEWNLSVRATTDKCDAPNGLPRPDQPTEHFVLDWQTFFGLTPSPGRSGSGAGGACTSPAGKIGAGGACTSSPPTDVGAGFEPALSASPIRPCHRESISFPAPADAAAVIRHAVERTRELFGRHLDDGECVHLMLLQFTEGVRDPRVRLRKRTQRVLHVAGWLCQAPHCRARTSFEVHHRRYRSRGGSDAYTNLVALCFACHRLVHEGLLSIVGDAPYGLWFRVHDRSGKIREVYFRGQVKVAS